MEINDYSKRLAQKSDQFDQNLQKISKNHQQEVDDLKKLHDYREKKQIATHQNQSRKLEDAYAQAVDKSNSKNLQEIDNRQKEFLAWNKNQEEDSLLAKKKMANDFHRRLDQIKNSYEKINEDQQLEHNQKVDYLTKKSQDRLSKQHQDYLDRTEHYSNNANKRLAGNIQAFKQDRENLLERFAKDQEESIKEKNNEKNQQKNYYEKNLEDLTKANDARAIEEKNYYQSRLDGIDKKNKLAQEAMKDQFNKLNETNQEKIIKEERSQAAKYVDMMKKMDESYAEDLRKIKKDAQRVTSREGREDQHELEKKLIENDYNNQLRSRDNYLREVREHGQYENQKMKDSYTNSVKLKKEKYADKIAEMEEEFRNSNKALLTKTSEERTRLLENNQLMLKDNTQRADAKVMSAEKIHKEQLKNYQRYHNDTISKIVDKNFHALSELKSGFVADKRDFVIKHQQETHDKMENLKNFYRQQMLGIAESYEQKISQLQNNLVAKDLQSEEKVQMLEDRMNEHIENNNVANAAKQAEDQRVFRQQLVAKEQEYEKKFIEKKYQYEQQISNLTLTKDNQIKSMVSGYEKEISKLQQDFQTEMNRKLAEAQQLHLRLIEDYETRLISMRGQYEARLEKLRQSKSSG